MMKSGLQRELKVFKKENVIDSNFGYEILTNGIYKGWFGVTVKEYK